MQVREKVREQTRKRMDEGKKKRHDTEEAPQISAALPLPVSTIRRANQAGKMCHDGLGQTGPAEKLLSCSARLRQVQISSDKFR